MSDETSPRSIRRRPGPVIGVEGCFDSARPTALLYSVFGVLSKPAATANHQLVSQALKADRARTTRERLR